MPTTQHLDDAWARSEKAATEVLDRCEGAQKAVVIHDVFGRIRLALSAPSALHETIRTEAAAVLGAAGLGPWIADVTLHDPKDDAASVIWNAAWADAVEAPDTAGRVRFLDRHRNGTAWFVPADRQITLWPETEAPPIVAFYSFKGGVGRTTAAAAYAIARARRGETVAVVDLDLDAPGIGILLDADDGGTTSRWGVLDFLLETGADIPLLDYRHLCAREAVTGSGAIHVFPAANLDDNYFTKLSRVDAEIPRGAAEHPLAQLLKRIRAEIRPSVILLDSRAGLSPSAGLLLTGLAHLHVLLSTNNEQSLRGIERVVHHLGHDRAARGLPQAECVVVQTLVPDNPQVAALTAAQFATRAETIFRDHYYASQRDNDDRLWSLDDVASSEAPHQPVTIGYRGGLADIRSIGQVATMLVESPDHLRLVERIDARLASFRGDE